MSLKILLLSLFTLIFSISFHLISQLNLPFSKFLISQFSQHLVFSLILVWSTSLSHNQSSYNTKNFISYKFYKPLMGLAVTISLTANPLTIKLSSAISPFQALQHILQAVLVLFLSSLAFICCSDVQAWAVFWLNLFYWRYL